jgi:hypothetical protein
MSDDEDEDDYDFGAVATVPRGAQNLPISLWRLGAPTSDVGIKQLYYYEDWNRGFG